MYSIMLPKIKTGKFQIIFQFARVQEDKNGEKL